MWQRVKKRRSRTQDIGTAGQNTPLRSAFCPGLGAHRDWARALSTGPALPPGDLPPPPVAPPGTTLPGWRGTPFGRFCLLWEGGMGVT